jgi:ornithine decarboxylase
MVIILENENMRAARASSAEDEIIFDLARIEERYNSLIRELPDVSVRFAMKSCPVNEVLVCLADKGAGFDAASPNEITTGRRFGGQRQCGGGSDRQHGRDSDAGG